MGKLIDLTGQRFGKWTVIERDLEIQKKKGSNKAFWKCKCECGTIRSVVGADLRSGKSQGCGCKDHAYNFVDLTGQKFNFLTVVKQLPNRYEKAYWDCICECGNHVSVSTSDLKNGHTKSCGCKKIERFQEIGKNSYKDLTGQQFGYLTVLRKTDNRAGSNVKWLCKCICGKEYEIAGGDLTKENGTRSCGCMSASKGEQCIANALKELNITFEKEKSFEDCRSPFTNHLLRYDFYLPDYNILIEYDGIQHFKEVSYFKDTLKEVQIKDTYKSNYTSKNRIPLIRIPYTDFNIIDTQYLKNKINEVKDIYG